jgi:predicted nicotinamide N-methyase
MKSSLLADTRREINPANEAATALACDTSQLPPLPCGWTVREYSFEARTLKLTIPDRPDALLEDPEVLAANDRDDYMPYWAYLWPAAIYMSKAVMDADWPVGTRVLELGCGVGLVGVAARAKGCQVTMTDYDAKSVIVAKHNARLNGFDDVDVFELDWRTPPQATYPVILGCDLLYEQRNLLPILDLMETMLEPGGVCWLADGGRSVAHQFWYLARERGYAVSMRDSEGREIMTPGFHYQLFELRRPYRT